MAENFDLIFGSSASQSYSWNDSDYQNGWQTVGDTPPTREQFDALQRRADLKAQELNNALTPLVNKSEADGRQASTAYTAGKFVTVDGLPNGWLLECVVGGTSGANAISIPATLVDGTTIVDGDVTWKLRRIATEGGLGYRQPSTAYTAGQIKYHATLPTGWYLECTTAGTTGSGALTITSPTVGGTVSDGTVTWTVRKMESTEYHSRVIYDNAAAHNGIYRGEDLTTYFNSGEMSAAIANGSFMDIYPGDYIIKDVTIDGTTYSGVKFIVMDLDPHLHRGDTATTTHHVAVMPEGQLGTAQMNSTSTTTGGYVGSAMWTTHIPKVVVGLEAAFGANHILEHRELLSNAINATAKPSGYDGFSGASSSWVWVSVKVNIANENMVYGAPIVSSSLDDTGEWTNQLAAFRLNPGLICSGQYGWWLRSVAYDSAFCYVYGSGAADNNTSASANSVRPYFLLK